MVFIIRSENIIYMAKSMSDDVLVGKGRTVEIITTRKTAQRQACYPIVCQVGLTIVVIARFPPLISNK